ncbi:DUF3644 domain-containing protein [Roseiflexus sp.]|uniref:DUF3644 domain-containing protein n=1 Tax=Roseiflexus sp. TaxID=2562120 RepID=UPI00345AD756
MIAAIEVYNKPDFKYRDESFAILAINAWELLIKAKWLMDHGNRINALYVYQNVNGRRRVKRNRSGTPMTYSIDYLAGKLYECGKLPKPVHQNLEILSDLRNSAVHFYYQKAVHSYRSPHRSSQKVPRQRSPGCGHRRSAPASPGRWWWRHRRYASHG